MEAGFLLCTWGLREPIFWERHGRPSRQQPRPPCPPLLSCGFSGLVSWLLTGPAPRPSSGKPKAGLLVTLQSPGKAAGRAGPEPPARGLFRQRRGPRPELAAEQFTLPRRGPGAPGAHPQCGVGL